MLVRRWRPAAVAAGTFAAATLGTALAAPEQSLIFWTEALWDTGRIGLLDYVSNQSLHGVAARLVPPHARSALWLIAVLTILVVWARRARRTDLATGFALTGVTACLISPITWVHHLVWLIPALILLADNGIRRLTALAAAMYVLLCSSVVWLWSLDYSGLDGFQGGNAYVWIGLSLLLALPITAAPTYSVVSAPEPGMARTHP